MRIPRSGLAALLASTLTAVGLTGAGPAASLLGTEPQVQATGLTQQLDTLLTHPSFTGSQVELVVRDATTGELLYDRNGGNRLLPASNMKLFTSAAATDVLGPSFRFHTDALATAPVEGGRLRGDLYLKGYGDPTTLASDYAALAEQVAAAAYGGSTATSLPTTATSTRPGWVTAGPGTTSRSTTARRSPR